MNDIARSQQRSFGSAMNLPPNIAYTTGSNSTAADQRLDKTIAFYPDQVGEVRSMRPGQSYYGELLDRTLEIMPQVSQQPNRPNREWYRTNWPTTWPTSDWQDSPAGTIPLVWETPFGQPEWHRETKALETNGQGIVDLEFLNGELTETKQPRSLADFSPLTSLPLLMASGLMDGFSNPGESYRTDRNPDRPWNDAGNPLIIAAASFIPPRHEIYQYDQNRVRANDNRGKSDGVITHSRPRDFLINQSRKHFGYIRSVHVSIGSLGYGIPASLDTYNTNMSGGLTWEATDEAELPVKHGEPLPRTPRPRNGIKTQRKMGHGKAFALKMPVMDLVIVPSCPNGDTMKLWCHIFASILVYLL